uniref:Uncharacterized protein n=1 Tax=Rhizophora mucronata TaxID=61149 RepID=A0A2P2LF28_RHIMU
MSQKSLVPASLQSIKSLPVDFKLTSLGSSSHLEKLDAINSENSEEIFSSIPENDGLGNKDVEGVENRVGDDANEDSPYGGSSFLFEEKHSVIDQDVDAEVLPLSSISSFRIESRWGDTTSYTAKKVTELVLFSDYGLLI